METITIAPSCAAVHPSAGGTQPQTWIAAVHAETLRLKTSSRTLGKRLDDAQDLVLGGAVTCDPEGMWEVESRTSPGVRWQVDGSCSCPDAEHAAQDGLCAHRLAVGITRRALKAVEASPAGHAASTTAPQNPGPITAPAAALPEAALSYCLRGKRHGLDAQLTVRGQTPDEFGANLQAVLARRGDLDALRELFDAAPAITPTNGSSPPASTVPPATTVPHATTPETPTCPTHGPMKPSSKAPGTFYCTKKLYDGSYCQSRHP